MEPHDSRFSEYVDIVKSLIPRSSVPSAVSRDYWMPDHSCRVCYECDSQFTVFNRKHHCRLCGRIFCSKCTSHFIPVSLGEPKYLCEEGGRIRVCNYCFKGWQQELRAADNDVQLSSPLLSPSNSTAECASFKSSFTGNSSTATADSFPYSTGAYEIAPPGRSVPMESHPDEQNMVTSNRNSVVDVGDPSSNGFKYFMNRDDEEDDDDIAFRANSETLHFQNSDEYYGPAEFEETAQNYGSNKVYLGEENTNPRISSQVDDNTEYLASLDADKMEGSGNDNNYECDASSAVYGNESSVTEPVDFENNRLLWLPPEPEDEEDEREALLYDDDDDDDATGEWGYLCSSSFGSGELRSRDRSNKEHNKAMKNDVDGHFRALVAQLLQVENLSMGKEDEDGWLEIITTLSWEAATLLKPDTSKGGRMDPGWYVKVKCIACGHRSESMVVRGVVCRKNVAHRRMSSKINKPRFLILGGALEYQRVSNTLSSVDTLLQQETDHLKMAVTKIDAHHPNVLLVEKSVSRFAQDCLLAKNISLVLNIKRPLLERVARCTGAQIVPSIDHLSSQKLGHCDSFHVEKFLEEHGSTGQGERKMVKTLMFFEGSPMPLGCTVLLKGANGNELKKVKHVVQYAIFAAYHLALETSFLADEGASLPELPLKSPITVALPDKPVNVNRSISTIPGFTIPAPNEPRLDNNMQGPNVLDATAVSCNLGYMPVSHYSSEDHNSVSDSACTFTSQYGKIGGFALGKDEQDEHVPGFSSTCRKETAKTEHSEVESLRDNGETIEERRGILERVRGVASDPQMENNWNMERLCGSSILEISHQDNAQSEELALPKEFPLSPSDHQSILVSLSSRCVWKGTVCERAHLLRIKYYASFDKPLGRFLRDHLFDQSHLCRSCEMPSEAHVHCYTHQQGSLTISVRKLSEIFLPGERDGKIWMWHRCLRCPRINGFPPATRRVFMSDAAWGLSFGKFLELSFSNNAAASRVASCGHSLHRDCLRFYGYGKMVACFRYASINLNSVYLPPPKLDFSYQHQDWIQKEADEVAKKAELLFNEILNKLDRIEEKRLYNDSLNGNVKALEPCHIIIELEELLKKEKKEFEEHLQKVVKEEASKGQPAIDILEINKLRRQLLFQSYFWDRRLIFAASSENNVHDVFGGFMEKCEAKLGSSNKLSDMNLTPKPLKGFLSLDALSPRLKSDEFLKGRVYAIDHQGYPAHLKMTNAVQERSDPEQDGLVTKQVKTSVIGPSPGTQLDPLDSGFVVRRVFSDGEFPIMADLSDTLDAKWRGENASAVTDACMLISSASVEGTYATSVFKESDKCRGDDVLMGDSDDCSNCVAMPFSDLYCSFNKNMDNASKIDSYNEYIPLYISLFQDLVRHNGARLLLPIGVNDIVIPVYDDEPTSVISYALVSPDYRIQASQERERARDHGDSPMPAHDLGNYPPRQSVDDVTTESLRDLGLIDGGLLSLSSSRSSLILDPLVHTKPMHVRVSFSVDGSLGKIRYTVTCYHADHFDELRRICCPSEVDFIRSLSRCKKWGAQGGKSNVFFAKSLDDRFIVKQVTKTELESFIQFAPEYFKYLSESITTGSPTCLAKILGIYQVTTKYLKGGKESRMDVLVMENLLFGRTVTKLYDLKGSSRSRYNPDASGNNKVLLDQNLIEAMPTSPIFVGSKSKRLLERAVWNDTAFLASIDVMDYSLLVGIDEEKHELVMGIIDFMRQYTWDKQLETWVKASGILGGLKNASPTVILPKQYKKRFRKAMSAYFLVVPDQWTTPSVILSKPQSNLCEDDQQSASVQS